jgi:hypothetical protein
MADRDDKDLGEKIVSLDQRRRADAARQKAEIAAQRKKRNGSGQGFNRPFGQPAATRAANAGAAPGGAARGIGKVVAMLVYGGLVLVVALAVFGWVSGR